MTEGAVLAVIGATLVIAALGAVWLFDAILDRLMERPVFYFHGLARDEVTALSIDDIDLLDQLVRTDLFADGRAALAFLQSADRLQVHCVLTHASEMREHQRRTALQPKSCPPDNN
jgi:hypothetical protein